MEITKRDGRKVPFEIEKIKNAISKAFKENNQDIDSDMLNIISLRAVAKAQKKSPELSVEKIQDAVESSLMECGFDDVAKSYILYRKNRENVRNTLIDVNKVAGEYVNLEDWRVKENSTVTYSVGGFILSNSGAITANYWLNNFYDKEVADAHRNCDIHLHDLSFFGPYCAGWSLKQLILEGLGGVPGKISSKPAKHLHTLCNQMVNFLGITQNEWAGAQAFSSFDTYLSAFVKKDNMSYSGVKQCIQSFIFGVNTPSRWGCVDTETEVLSVDGFKKYDELKAGDVIYTWKDGHLNTNTVNAVVVKPFRGKMHSYKGEGYHQFVTPEHRMLVKTSDSDYHIERSYEVFDNVGKYTFMYIPSLILNNMNEKIGGAEISEIDGKDITISEVDYDGIVWCPNVNDGTAIFRKDNCIFISGQSQAPFTNVTLDWVVPEDLKDMPAIVGGEPQDFTYGDCQKEMDMVNKAFIEIMLEGDANGRGFQYPMNLGLNVAYYSDIV